MGLDMYLNKRTYIGAKFKHSNVKGSINITKGDDNKPVNINFRRVSEIIEEVGYWRKANHIHNWFVEQVQNGTDDCKEYYVTSDNLLSLKDTCKVVVDFLDKCEKEFDKDHPDYYVYDIKDSDIVSDVLPTSSGFFFGSTDYDKWYYEDLKDTINMIEELEKEEDFSHSDFYYQSSW